jgi:hypothetical protein
MPAQIRFGGKHTQALPAARNKDVRGYREGPASSQTRDGHFFLLLFSFVHDLRVVVAFHQEDAGLEDCHFDFCRQCLATACVLSLLQDLRTRVQDFFPAPPSKCAAMLGIAMGRCRLVASLGGSFGALSNLACSLKTIRSKRLFPELYGTAGHR